MDNKKKLIAALAISLFAIFAGVIFASAAGAGGRDHHEPKPCVDVSTARKGHVKPCKPDTPPTTETPDTPDTTEPETPTTTEPETPDTTVPEPLPECPPYTYDGVLPEDGGTGPIFENGPPDYDCDGGLYCVPPSMPVGEGCLIPPEGVGNEHPEIVIIEVPVEAETTPVAAVQTTPAFTG